MKKVLIITYYWPPCGGIGVLRCLKFAKYLRQHGWEPIIFTAENAHYPSLDYSNEKDIPEGITVLKQKIWEPYHIYKFITGQKKESNVNNVFYASEKKLGYFHKLSVWIRSNFFIPDARALWIKPSVKTLLKYLRENPVDAILSNGPPHSNTRIATLLKKETGIPWLADFQDPWSQVDYFSMLHLTPWGRKKHLRMEQEVFQYADAITIVSDSWKKDLESIGARNVSVLPWGFDQDDFQDLTPATNHQFVITHTGILGNDRIPNALLDALKKLLQVHPELLNHLTLQLTGIVDASVKSAITEAGLTQVAQYAGTVERKVALQHCMDSSIQLLMLNRQENAGGRIPGKLFEYLATGKPILCFGPPKSDVATIIQQTGRGYYCTFDDIDACYSAIKTLYRQYIEGYLPQYAREGITIYSNHKITGMLAETLNNICKK